MKFLLLFDLIHIHIELTIFAKTYLPNLKLIKQGEIQKLLPKTWRNAYK